MAQQPKPTREDRLKAALKANMARRKAQKRVRAEDAPEAKPDEQETTDG